MTLAVRGESDAAKTLGTLKQIGDRRLRGNDKSTEESSTASGQAL